MDRFRDVRNSEAVNRMIREGREKLGKSAAEHLAGLTPEQLARLEQTAARLTPTQLQGALTRAFANLDPATLAQIADKFAASGVTAPADRRTDPATLAVLAATAMKGRVGGIASLLMILAGTRLSSHARAMANGQSASAGLTAARDIARHVMTSATSRETQERITTLSTRGRFGIAQAQKLGALAKSPLARKVMQELGPVLLKQTHMPPPAPGQRQGGGSSSR